VPSGLGLRDGLPAHTGLRFEGRTEAAKRALIVELFTRVEAQAGISPHSLEITITETPKVNWGIRG
jgi:phenylpyruvate tautomerase PptA (4-oxalocrotonate tautomerase family)